LNLKNLYFFSLEVNNKNNNIKETYFLILLKKVLPMYCIKAHKNIDINLIINIDLNM
tara:strand:- start:2009 stop:2179 length:171 start_codon:yes stop_codon:yes gene_type:complete